MMKKTQYPGYPMNVYNYVSSDKNQKMGKRQDMYGSDSIVFIIYIRKDILSVRTHSFITGKSISKDMEHINERIADFGAFNEEAKGIEITCNTIQTSISIWKEYLEIMIENNEWLCSSESKSC